MSNFKTTIGLEIHIELKTRSKMFCDCQNPASLKDNIADREPNTFVCPICMGFPGVLPVANKQAIDWTILTGLALNCKIPKIAKFDRKHYFYPDLPKGFQISQYDKPFAIKGYLKLKNKNLKLKTIRIKRVHLEEDAGKLIHPKGKNYSLVDLNRAGTPLMEIVTEPDLESPQEAKKFVKKLRLILRYLGISDADMEKGHLRCDANIDIKKQSTTNNLSRLGSLRRIEASRQSETDKQSLMSPIVEIKNLNSFRFIEKALTFEEKRLKDEVDDWPKKRTKITRGFDSKNNQTYPQREKEEASDYRYFPEPDLPIFKFKSSDIKKIKELIPQLPDNKFKKYTTNFKLNANDANILISDFQLAKFFEEVVAEKINPQKAANWILTELLGRINKSAINISENKIKPINLAALIKIIDKKQISNKNAKEIFNIMFDSGKSPDIIITDLDIGTVLKNSEIEKICDKIIDQNKALVENYQKGKKQVLQFFVGQVMKETKGRVNPGEVVKILINKLKG